ncbi:hypothetical protein QQ045_005219 [Rhodiola kirilowii]
MMNSFGFPSSWTKLVMECVTTVRYKVKVNDLLVDISPRQIGLRQEDPLSPYLFLLCSEWLSIQLEKETLCRSLKVVRVSHGAPVVTHLFFADDSIYFMKATKANARTLLFVLREYETISSQRINFAKSKIYFSRNVSL